MGKAVVAARSAGRVASGWLVTRKESVGSPTIPVGARLRADATAWYRRAGLNASYSRGYFNYGSGLKGGDPGVYARVLRLGVAYRLR